jgi:hypothetical protein
MAQSFEVRITIGHSRLGEANLVFGQFELAAAIASTAPRHG